MAANNLMERGEDEEEGLRNDSHIKQDVVFY